MLNPTSSFAAALTDEPTDVSGAGMPKAKQPGQIHTIFNKTSRGLLNHLLARETNIPDESWHTLSDYPAAGSVTDKKNFIAAYIERVFKAEWPEPQKPAPLAADADNRTRIAHEREMASYKKAKRFHDTQYGPSLTYFTEQVLKAWPGYKESVSKESGEHLPEPILPEDYPRFAQSLLWYLTQARGENNARLAQTAHDLRTTSLQEIQSEWIKTFPSSVTSQHLKSCDDLFINCEIPENTPSDARHPDPAVKTHAEILATGQTADGTGWTLRRINSQVAATYYGNTERTADGSPRQNASPLCFTWSGKRINMFSTYSRDLLMIACDDGSVVRFLHVNKSMYNDMRDKPIDLKQIFQEFPALDQAIGPLILTTLQISIDSMDVPAFCELLEAVNGVPEWRDAATPQAVKFIPTALQTSIDSENLSAFYGLLKSIKSVPEWRDAATPQAVKFIPTAFQRSIDRKDTLVFGELLESVNGVPEWKDAATTPQAIKFIPTALQRSIDNIDPCSFCGLLQFIKGIPEWQDEAIPLAVKLIQSTFQADIDRKDVHKFCAGLDFIIYAPERQDVTIPLAIKFIPTALQISIDRKDVRVFGYLLESVKDIPEWKDAAWEGFGRKASPETQEIMIDILGPMPDFGTLAPATAEALTHS